MTVLLLAMLLQYPRSQHASVSQRIQATEITITYNRPVARGRNLFGGVVAWNHMWHPGADSSTTLSFSKDVTYYFPMVDADSAMLRLHWGTVVVPMMIRAH